MRRVRKKPIPDPDPMPNAKAVASVMDEIAPMSARDWHWTHFLKEEKGHSRADHLLKLLPLTWPEFGRVEDGKILWSDRFNPWIRRMFSAFCTTEYCHTSPNGNTFRAIMLAGAGASGKTHNAALFALAFWAVDPKHTIAILTSTTKEMLRRRVWSVVQHYHKTMVDANGEALTIGYMKDSQAAILAEKGDDKHAIYCLAVAHGETQKAVHNLKGQHADRVILVIDEANGTPEAIFQAITNLRKGCREFVLIVIGNPVDKLDCHGRCCKPYEGWETISMEQSEMWQTAPCPEWQIEAGLCLRFDGKKSPNVLAGDNLYPYLYLFEDWKNAEQHQGYVGYYSNDRGFWPPDGLSKTVFNPSLIDRCGVMDHFDFIGGTQLIAYMDTAFGGDDCVIQFGQMGNIDGKMAIQLTDVLVVPIDAEAKAQDVDYQVARKFIQECQWRRVKPEYAGLDAEGTGRGVASIVTAEWSADVQYVRSSGSASERASAQHDGRPSSEVYDRMITELWFSTREVAESGQIRGMSDESMRQFCARQYTMVGKKYRIEPKPDMKLRLHYSPDEADSVAGLVEVARRNGFEIQARIAPRNNLDEFGTPMNWRKHDEEAMPSVDHEASGWAEANVSFDFHE